MRAFGVNVDTNVVVADLNQISFDLFSREAGQDDMSV